MAEEHDNSHGEEQASHGHGGGGGHGAHGGGAHEEHEGAPEWLISFADNVALMMGFFVILLAMNMGPKGGGEGEGTGGGSAASQPDMIDFVIGMREAFNNPISETSTRADEAVFVRRMLERKGGAGKPESQTGKDPDGGAMRPSDYRNVVCTVEFDDRSSLLSEQSRDALHEAAEKLRGQRWIIEVRGHVSPFESMRNPRTAMQLSFDRAMAAATSLADAGIPWPSLRIVAVGDHDLIGGLATERGRDGGNQCAEIMVTNEVMASDPYAAPASRSGGSGTGHGGAHAPATAPVAHEDASGMASGDEGGGTPH